MSFFTVRHLYCLEWNMLLKLSLIALLAIVVAAETSSNPSGK